MKRRRSTGIIIAGYLLGAWGLILLIGLLIVTPLNGLPLLFMSLGVSGVILSLAQGILRFKEFSRRFVLIVVVPYLTIFLPFLYRYRIQIEAANFYALFGLEPRILSMDIVMSGFWVGTWICFISIALGAGLLFFLTRPKVKAQFKR